MAVLVRILVGLCLVSAINAWRLRGSQLSSMMSQSSTTSTTEVSTTSGTESSLGAVVSRLIIQYWEAMGLEFGDQDYSNNSDVDDVSGNSIPQGVPRLGDWCYPECVTNRSAIQDLYDCHYFIACLHIPKFGNEILPYRCKCPDDRPIFNPYLKVCRSAGRCSEICTSKSDLYATWPKIMVSDAHLMQVFECQYDESLV
ncbi:unnamed protein product, partial [Meganyctiphanes norvegica]